MPASRCESFYLTFGQQYPWHDSWVRIDAPSYDVARRAVINLYDRRWSTLYTEDHFDRCRHLFRQGELLAFETDEHLNYRRLS